MIKILQVAIMLFITSAFGQWKFMGIYVPFNDGTDPSLVARAKLESDLEFLAEINYQRLKSCKYVALHGPESVKDGLNKPEFVVVAIGNVRIERDQPRLVAWTDIKNKIIEISSRAANSLEITIIHELIHIAGLKHELPLNFQDFIYTAEKVCYREAKEK